MEQHQGRSTICLVQSRPERGVCMFSSTTHLHVLFYTEKLCLLLLQTQLNMINISHSTLLI